MKLIFVIMGTRKLINILKLEEAVEQLGKKDSILVSGDIEMVVNARLILDSLGIDQSRILLDIKFKGIRKFVKEYMNGFKEITLISENDMEERLIKAMYTGKLKIVRI